MSVCVGDGIRGLCGWLVCRKAVSGVSMSVFVSVTVTVSVGVIDGGAVGEWCGHSANWGAEVLSY